MSVNSKYAQLIHRSNTLFNSGLSYKNHQAEGIQWCVFREKSSQPGAFITDEMGLGKTIIVIMTCLINIKKSTLFVLPSSLLLQWKQQIKKFTGHDALVYHGYSKKKISKLDLLSNPIVLTTYHSIAISKKHNQPSILHDITWDRVVYDEAHYLRNKNGNWAGASLLNSRFTWFVTGTPIQNKSSDFSNLCKIINIPVQNASILRRTKLQAGIELPPPTFHNIQIPWSNTQEYELARQIHYQLRFADDSTNYIVGMQLCKQACIYPKLLQKNQHHIQSQLISQPIQDNLDIAFEQCSKLQTVANTLYKRNQNGNGKIVFCQYKQEMTQLASLLRSKGMSVCSIDSNYTSKQKTSQLQGSCIPENTSISQLPLELSSYINSFLVTDVTLLQIQSSCEGLNLQDNYNEVYFVGPSWNPSIEAQAIARCHRIGQKKKVEVFRFYMEVFTQTDFPVTLNHNDEAMYFYNMDQYILRKQNLKTKISEQFFENI